MIHLLAASGLDYFAGGTGLFIAIFVLFFAVVLAVAWLTLPLILLSKCNEAIRIAEDFAEDVHEIRLTTAGIKEEMAFLSALRSDAEETKQELQRTNEMLDSMMETLQWLVNSWDARER